MKILIIAALSFVLAGCGSVPTPEPIVRTVEVKIPIVQRVACVGSDFPASPEYPDTRETLLAAPDAAARYQLLIAGRDARNARLIEAEAVIEACRMEGDSYGN